MYCIIKCEIFDEYDDGPELAIFEVTNELLQKIERCMQQLSALDNSPMIVKYLDHTPNFLAHVDCSGNKALEKLLIGEVIDKEYVFLKTLPEELRDEQKYQQHIEVVTLELYGGCWDEDNYPRFFKWSGHIENTNIEVETFELEINKFKLRLRLEHPRDYLRTFEIDPASEEGQRIIADAVARRLEGKVAA